VERTARRAQHRRDRAHRHNGLLFGGVDAAAATSDPRGIGRGPGGVGAHLGIDHYRTDKLVNRGVLLDVARFLAGIRNPSMPASRSPRATWPRLPPRSG
jgi:hypothetical protein